MEDILRSLFFELFDELLLPEEEELLDESLELLEELESLLELDFDELEDELRAFFLPFFLDLSFFFFLSFPFLSFFLSLPAFWGLEGLDDSFMLLWWILWIELWIG